MVQNKGAVIQQLLCYLIDSLALFFNANQFIATASHADFLGMLGHHSPIGRGKNIAKVIAVRMFRLIQRTSFDKRLSIASICTGYIQCDRIKRGKHTDIGNNRHIILAMAIAARGDIHHDIDMETRTTIDNSLRILRHFTTEIIVCGRMNIMDGIIVAGSYTSSASDAPFVIDQSLLFRKRNCIVCAIFDAFTASDAIFTRNLRLASMMLLHFTRSRGTPHTDVLDCTSEACTFMSFKMRKRNQHIGIMMARPIFASVMYSPPFTGTAISSVPFIPSAITI